MKGTLSGYGDVWYDNRAMTNILSLNNMKKKYKITYDSSKGDRFTVHKPDKLVHFTCSKNGLYYHDTRNRQINLVNTVEENLIEFNKCQKDRARKARELYSMVGYPSIADFKKMVKFNLIMNCPVSEEDIDNSMAIYGPDI